MSFKVNVRFDIDPNMLDASVKYADEVLAEQAMKDTEPFVPALTGSMTNQTKVEGGTIIYPGPQAKFLWHGKLMVDPETGSPWARYGSTKVLTDRNLVFQKSMHAQAQAEWFEASKALNMAEWEKVYKKAVISKK